MGMHPQKRQYNVMIPAQRQHDLLGGKYLRGMRLESFHHLLAGYGFETEIAAVNDAQLIEVECHK